jgi:uncharacterized membrane protein YgcG
VRAALVALVAAGLFFAGAVAGVGGSPAGEPRPRPVVLTGVEVPGGTEGEVRNAPLEVYEVPRQVEEGTVDEYEIDGDSSGPGPNSGPGGGDDGDAPDDEDAPDQPAQTDDVHTETSGPGSDSSGTGSSGSGSSGSSGSGSSGSDSSGSGS